MAGDLSYGVICTPMAPEALYTSWLAILGRKFSLLSAPIRVRVRVWVRGG